MTATPTLSDVESVKLPFKDGQAQPSGRNMAGARWMLGSHRFVWGNCHPLNLGDSAEDRLDLDDDT